MQLPDMFTLAIIGMILLVVLGSIASMRARKSMPFRMARMMQQMQEVMMEVPALAIPEGTRTTSGQTEVRSVRLPTKCPSCQAPVSHEGIDWIGPLQARCTYCGATINANFERI